MQRQPVGFSDGFVVAALGLWTAAIAIIILMSGPGKELNEDTRIFVKLTPEFAERCIEPFTY